jgi:hypothetical protein
MGDYFSQNTLLAMPAFYESMSENTFFILLKLLHFAVSEAYHG